MMGAVAIPTVIIVSNPFGGGDDWAPAEVCVTLVEVCVTLVEVCVTLAEVCVTLGEVCTALVEDCTIKRLLKSVQQFSMGNMFSSPSLWHDVNGTCLCNAC
jgi:hypothetical protein